MNFGRNIGVGMDSTDLLIDSEANSEGAATILILIITFSSRDETLATIQQLEALLAGTKNQEPSIQAVIWDNRSWELTHDGNVSYHSSPNGNVGFGAAVNSVRKIYDYDRVLLLNSDIEMNEDLFDRIINRTRTLSSETIWAPMLINADGTPQTSQSSLYMRTPIQEVLDIFGYPAREQRRSTPLHYLRGAVFSISTELLDMADGFDEKFFLYGEEADLCFRLSRVARLYMDDEIEVVHHGSQGHKGKSAAALRHSLHARVLLHRRYNGGLAGAVVLTAVLMARVALKAKRMAVKMAGKFSVTRR